ncbi:GNAT family N-acetyltransferase [Acanthopleuribacter pedis]|uniref:GNAT family N-acetyltransferase n=1 Tax=Acanthopleuribacter pedis TaxID=442870 RepID=A0A8J7QBF1_9BACT|nr:GNAT family N-acetyltransferase [Acanthopleuribacter pedis]MBO1317831.1 GNAT family N-acetyltransferase [Acanthopleuribacter pedis]
MIATLKARSRREAVTIRRAQFADREAIHSLIQHFARAGEMLPVPLDGIGNQGFLVAEVDGEVVACGALKFWEDGTVEIRSLAVAAHMAGRGIGKLLVRQLASACQVALPNGVMPQLFALTLKPAFFLKVGFDIVPRGMFAAKERGDCVACPFKDACREIAVLWRGSF